MTTKAKPRANPLAEIEALEAAWAEARDEAKRIGKEHATKATEAKALTDERGRLVHREPELVNHLGEPAEAGNAVAKVDERLNKVGDLGDAWARVEHARAVEKATRRRFEEAVSQQPEVLRRAEYGRDAELREKFADVMRVATEIAERRIAVTERLMMVAAACRESTRIAGADAVIDTARTARNLAESTPAPRGEV